MQTNHKNKILSRKELVSKISQHKARNRKVAFTNGCFDIVHIGHIGLFYKASIVSDIVVVAINSDASVSKLKGKSRPVIGQEERAEIIASIQYVDYVTIFDELTPIDLIKDVKPDILIKGGDWSKDDIVGSDFVKSIGGKVINSFYVEGKSSSNIISNIKPGK